MMKKECSVRALTFEYHGIADHELRAAKAVAKAAAVKEHRLVRLPDLREVGEMEEGMFAGYPSTYIPMRNGVFYSFGASYAEEVRADFVVGGHNKDDRRAFRDVDPKFFAELQRAFWAGSRIIAAKKTRILRPLAEKTKVEVVGLAAGIGVPFELTWSCHKEGSEHCWLCEGCLGRAESFERAGVPDPLNSVRAGKIT